MSPLKVIKITGIALLALVVLMFAAQLINSSLGTVTRQLGLNTSGITAPSFGKGAGIAYDGDYAVSESAMDTPSLSYRNVTDIYPPTPQSPAGDDAEEFEITQYNATVETRNLKTTCGTVSALKALDYVIFENANEYDRGCSFTFKVAHANVEEILGVIKGLDPKELSENTYTIKRQIDDFTNEVEVLEKKRASIDETLQSALSAYNEITRLATNTQNADALAKIIDSKIQIIERLTKERININEQLDRLSRAKADQLDRLDYTYFYVNVYENKFVDGEQIVDSWKAAIQSFVRDLNKVLQDLTINLLLLFFFILQWALYALIALILAKYGWKIGKYIWNK